MNMIEHTLIIAEVLRLIPSVFVESVFASSPSQHPRMI